MRVELYNFTDVSNVANKLKNLTPVWSGEVTPYGEFSAYSAEFRLNNLYKVNLCRYEFNSIWYIGTVTVSTNSEGMHTYAVAIDALSTAYYNGNLHSQNYIERRTGGISKNRENLLPWKDSTQIEKISLTAIPEDASNYFFLVQTTWGGENFGSTGLDSPEASKAYKLWPYTDSIGKAIYPIGIITYCLTSSQFEAFSIGLASLDDSTQKKIAPALFRICAIEKDLVNTAVLKRYYCGVKLKVGFFDVQVNQNCAAISILAEDGINYGIPISFNSYASGAELLTHRDEDCCYAFSHFSNVGGMTHVASAAMSSGEFPQANENIDSTLQFKFRHSQQGCKISLRDINVSEAKFVGFKAYVDPGKFTVTYIPTIDETQLKEYASTGEITTQIPMPVDISVTNWGRLVSSSASTLITIGAGMVTQNPTITMGGAVNLMGEFQQTRFEEKNGSYTVVGGAGGNNFWASLMPDTVIVQTSKVDTELSNIPNFRAKFGTQDHVVHVIDSISGYIQTQNCKLISKDLPADIIASAESQCDAGFYIR